MTELVRVTIAANELHAELLCGMLTTEGIPCIHRITNMGFGTGGELPLSGGGAREVLVHADRAEAARALIAAHAVPDDAEDDSGASE